MSSARDRLREALAAEREGRLADAFVLCSGVLSEPDLQTDGFNLFGRLYRELGDAANAIASQRYVLTLDPGHARAAADLIVALGAVDRTFDARGEYRAAIAPYPDVACHHRDPESLLPFAGMARIEERLHAILARDPSFAPAHAALGNIRARERRLGDAFEAYRIATMLAWEWSDVHLAMAGFFDSLLDDANAERHRSEALARQRTYPAVVFEHALRVLVATAPGDPTANAPLDFCIDHERIALHRHYLAGDEPRTVLPAYDLVFNAIEDAERSSDAIARCVAFIAAQSRPAINDPRNLARVRRSALPHTLARVAGCVLPATERIERATLAAAGDSRVGDLSFPLLVRPVDTHRGDWQERIDTGPQLRAYLERAPGAAFNVSEFVDYRSSDGYYRKYRAIVVDGKPFAYHLAIADTWKVHYHSSLMAEFAWMRAEEERFLRLPQAAIASWDTVFGEIAAAVGLEYFGVDCALDRDGNLLVFECGPSMLVQCRDEEPFAYKHAYVPRIFTALEDLLHRVARSAQAPT
jgi:glutathione synthase/RimK-type ligase-like ATP-grasp enzyme